MSQYNAVYHHEWYERNRERLLPIRRKYNKADSARPEVIEKAKDKNARPEIKLGRKLYKKTEAGRISNLKYRRKLDVKAKYENLRLKRLYGITTEQYLEILKKQSGMCAICGRSDTGKLHVDHCHETNKVRGLLCGPCNKAIGLFKDKSVLLNNAIQYLNKHA